jgi:beta-galactosidase
LRSILPFNDNWLFCPREVDASTSDQEFVPVTLPHTTNILPHHNFDVSDYAFISTYRKRFHLPEPLAGRRVYIDFDGAMIASTVSINGHTFEEYRGGYTPFSFDLTDHLDEAGENLLTVRLDSTERQDIPPFGNVVDYLTFSGIYRDVRLRLVEPCHITDVFVRPLDVLSGAPRVEIDVTVKNQGTQTAALSLRAELIETTRQVEPVRAEIAPGLEQVTTLRLDSPGEVELWSLHNPALYHMRVELRDGSDLVDAVQERFGFRTAEFRKDGGFYLNGERVKLFGLNRHQTYPYIGAAAPARLQRRDADIMRYELGCNIARTSHYPQSSHFLDRCDEIGLLVFEEIPGWQHIGDDDWKALSLRDVRSMIERDRNHPSIILWGVRINESWDDEAFYDDTNTLARQLDPTRQTGGVRFFIDSQFIEDVFTYNDFSNTIIEPKHVPHLVTEFSGHMYPTKTFDQEERVMEHALRHARIQNQQMGMDNVSGAIGWCAFDYNTHREFGSGDRICYHGVMDIFRLPKWAAYVYQSQLPPSEQVVLQAATLWTMGDRSEGGNDPLVIFSNCDEVEVFVGDEREGRYQPDRENFPHLPHPPYYIKMPNLFWGNKFKNLKVVGYVDGQAVAEQHIDAGGLPTELILELDDDTIQADGADMTRLAFKIVDRFGNRLPYVNQVITFEIEGEPLVELIGENPFALIGGQAALYVKAGHNAGKTTIRAQTPRLEPVRVTVNLR